jgi:hypothetical protein
MLVMTANLYGQVDRGALTGTVTGSSGLGLSGASIIVVQSATGLKRVAVTSSSGTYDIPDSRVAARHSAVAYIHNNVCATRDL